LRSDQSMPAPAQNSTSCCRVWTMTTDNAQPLPNKT